VSSPVSALAVCQGAGASFSVSASGTGLTYQWRFNGTPITGNASATTPNLTLTNVSTSASGSYDCVVSGTCGASGAVSGAGVLTVNTPISITTQPVSQVVCSRADVSFSVANVGTGAVYQWFFNGNAIFGNPSAQTNTLTVTGVSAATAGTYRAIVTGTCNVVGSSTATLSVQNVLNITGQPEPSRICAGSTLQATVSATGTILGYQWQKDGVDLPGQVGATLTIPGAGIAQSGNYRCVISGSSACGTAVQVSNTVEMVVGTSPSITRQPSNVAVSFGSTVSAQVDAAGLGYGVNNTMQYAWFKGTTRLTDGSRFSGTGTNVLTIRGVQPSDIGSDYYVVVSGVCGNTTSNQFSLFVPAVNITGQPQGAELCAGQTTVFSVVAVPNPSTSQLTYQWFKGTTRVNDGPNVSGATTSSMTLRNATTGDAGDYTCEITVQPGGSRVTTSVARLTVNTPASITVQPVSQSVCDGSALNLSVTGAGGSLQYQWKKGGTDITGATSSTYTVNASSAADAGSYTVTVRNGCGSLTSETVTVTISTKPVITTQPSATVSVGLNGTITLTVSATGSGTLTYQWKLNGNAIAGATNATYTKTGASKNDEGTYVCEVTNACGTVTTNTSAVSVSTTDVTDADVYGYVLGTPEPNPMGEVTTLKIRVPVTGAVRVDLSDVSGRVVATLVDGILDAGEHVEVLSASRNNLGSGVYTLRMVTSEGYVSTKRLVIVR
ncbi:MAG: immunoglobulin domain-containing protein, partial [Candidatus Kapaibacterium sp.]